MKQLYIIIISCNLLFTSTATMPQNFFIFNVDYDSLRTIARMLLDKTSLYCTCCVFSLQK